MSKKLFVGNLPFDVNDADLATVVAVAGTVASAKIVINKKTGRSKGYGFVEMETEEAANEAIKKFEGATLNERPLTVQLATPKQEAQATHDEGAEGTAAEGKTETNARHAAHANQHAAPKPAGIFGAKKADTETPAAPADASAHLNENSGTHTDTSENTSSPTSSS